MVEQYPHYRMLRRADFAYGVPLLGWLLRSRGPEAQLLTPYSFIAGGRAYRIPEQYRWDGASIPPIFWGPPWNYLPFGTTWDRAALEHDFLCDIGKGGSAWLRAQLQNQYPEPFGLTSDQVHRHFHDRARHDGTDVATAAHLLKAVHNFGPRWGVAQAQVYR